MPNRRIDDAHAIAGLLFGAVELTRARFDGLCARFGMTPVQARALIALDRPKTMGELASELRCDPSNITGLADRLQNRGLIRRDTATGDRRVKTLVLTPRGEAARAELESALLETSPFMAALDASERKALRELLAKINAVDDGDRRSDSGEDRR